MEIYIIVAIIFIQIYVFKWAYDRIQSFKYAIHYIQKIQIKKTYINVDQNDLNSPLVTKYQLYSESSSATYENIESSINQYLNSNKGATADMSLLKNIVERNVQKLENEISVLTPLPLYLGLIGTMAGIVLGLFQIPSVDSVGFSDGRGIDLLIGGVKYAMICSLLGVLFTSILSGFFFRNAKYINESRVNDFLTFLETELLPVLKDDVSANLYFLYQNLENFNFQFSKNVGNLQSIMNKNYDSLKTQDRILENLQNVDINKLASANVRVFEQMEKLMPQFELLNNYVEGINENIHENQVLTENIKDIIIRTNQVGDIASYLQTSTNKSIQLNEIVEKYFDDIKERTNVLKLATNVMEDESKRSVEHFKSFVEEQIKALRTITREEEEMIIRAFEENRNILSKLNELSEIKVELKRIREKPEVSEQILFQLKNINENLNISNNMNKSKIQKNAALKPLSNENLNENNLFSRAMKFFKFKE